MHEPGRRPKGITTTRTNHQRHIETLEDVQNSLDTRQIHIERVGIKGIELPFTIRVKDNGHQSVVAHISLAADLPEQYKGTHLSRFVEVLEKWSHEHLYLSGMSSVLDELITNLGAQRAYLTLRFKYFMKKQAPVSRRESTMGYDVVFMGRRDTVHGYTFAMGCSVPLMVLCPCSKAISAYGAHNQRSVVHVKIKCRPGEFLWIEDLVHLVEQQGSCELFPILKREDEKYVTEHSYENPKFVEDVLRDVVTHLRADPRIVWFSVDCESFESIHSHNAFASHAEGSLDRDALDAGLGLDVAPIPELPA